VGTVPTSSPPVWGHEKPHGCGYLVPGPHSPHTFPRRTRTPVGRIFSPFRSREEKRASRAWGSSHKSGDCGDLPSFFPVGRCSPVPTAVGTVWGPGDRPGDAPSCHPDAVRSCRTLPGLGGGPSRRSVRSSGAPRGSGVSRGVGQQEVGWSTRSSVLRLSLLMVMAMGCAPEPGDAVCPACWADLTPRPS